MTDTKESTVIKARVGNVGKNVRVVHDVDGKMVNINPGASVVIHVPRRQFNDMRNSASLQVSETDGEITNRSMNQRARPTPMQTMPPVKPKDDGDEGKGDDEVTISTAKELLEMAGTLPYKELVEAARAILEEDFPESPAQPKKKDIIKLLEARAEKE